MGESTYINDNGVEKAFASKIQKDTKRKRLIKVDYLQTVTIPMRNDTINKVRKKAVRNIYHRNINIHMHTYILDKEIIYRLYL